MSRPRAAGVVGCSVWLLAALAPGASAAERCNGKPVDISGSAETIRGTEGADVIQGGRSTRRILGLGGRDTICGGPAGNQILGGAGSDTLIGNGGRDQFLADATDRVAGGGDKDYVSYQDSQVGVEVDLARGVVQSVVLGDEGADGRVLGVENVIGTDFGDDLRGDRRDNGLNGKDGDDFIDGRGGEDRLLGGDGARDEVSYASAPAKVRTFDPVLEPGLYGFVRSEKDELVDFEVVTGSDFDDSLGGTERGDSLYGGRGDDRLKGVEGDDRLFGGAGNDIFAPGPDDDYVEGGANRPVTGTKQPGDLVNFRKAKLEDGADHLEVCLDLVLCVPPGAGDPSRFPNASGEGDDRIVEVESARAMENELSILDGNNGPNVLVGGKKEDNVHGWGGDDFVFTVGGEDSLWGDDGDDYLDPGGDTEMMDGGGGQDTCLHAHPEFTLDCERTPGGAEQPA
jgi:Ca2+-binding RTX toxin-like protein